MQKNRVLTFNVLCAIYPKSNYDCARSKLEKNPPGAFVQKIGKPRVCNHCTGYAYRKS